MPNKIHIANYHDTQLGYYCGRANSRHGLQASALANPFPLDKGHDTPIVREKLCARYETHLRAQIAQQAESRPSSVTRSAPSGASLVSTVSAAPFSARE